jgi:deoxyribonuclease V
MVLALDVHYKGHIAKAVGVLFEWEDIMPKEIIIEYVEKIEEYIPGEFYKRELPCLLKIIKKINLKAIEAIIIDGYVYIDNNFKYGLGGILWENLEQQIPIVGIAKTSFFSNKDTVKELFRGCSKKPLFISSIDYNVEKITEKIMNMSGNYRMPNILIELDRITKES